jgi:hypothetical protein
MNSRSFNMQFNIHGDNIVECERTLSLITRALDGEVINAHGPFDSAVCPLFQVWVRDYNLTLNFRYFPGFGRWSQDILALIRQRGGLLREAADVIITQVTDTFEEPLIAIEYCGALPAGNQAWQRNGRAYSFAKAGIPYVYMAEVGGYELDVNRGRKSTRIPNPAVPFSYLALSTSTHTLVAQVVVASPGADAISMQSYKDVFGFDVLLSLIRKLILGRGYKEEDESLKHNLLEFVQLLAAGRRRKDTLTPDQWKDAYEFISSGGRLDQYVIQRAPLPWAKMAYIEALTDSARKLMDCAAKYAVGLTGSSLPICVIPPHEYQSFAEDVRNLYSNLSSTFAEWLLGREKLAICWIMGFKPRGDDARPDRGLAPMARMLIGEQTDLLTVVYGPAPITTWPYLENDPVGLMKANGLWEAILTVSDAVLIDSRTASSLRSRAFLKSHWEAGIPERRELSILIPPAPVHVGEHDVDTVLHQLFSRLAGDQVFEGMCNPPGGDWSGLSLLTPDRSLELRWLSLPRVTAETAKRPDHLFQVFGIDKAPTALIVESKERAEQVETDIGPRLIKYVMALSSTLPSIQRIFKEVTWTHATVLLPPKSIQFASAVAFVDNAKTDLARMAQRASTDVVFGLDFGDSGRNCTIRAHERTPLGRVILDFMRNMSVADANITISRD